MLNRTDEELLRSEKESRRKDEASDTFLENSERVGRQRVRLLSAMGVPLTVQQWAAVIGRHGRRGSFMSVEVERGMKRLRVVKERIEVTICAYLNKKLKS